MEILAYVLILCGSLAIVFISFKELRRIRKLRNAIMLLESKCEVGWHKADSFVTTTGNQRQIIKDQHLFNNTLEHLFYALKIEIRRQSGAIVRFIPPEDDILSEDEIIEMLEVIAVDLPELNCEFRFVNPVKRRRKQRFEKNRWFPSRLPHPA